MKRLVVWTLRCFVIASILAIGIGFYVVKVHPTADSEIRSQGSHIVWIPRGTGLNQLGKILKDAGLIQSAPLFFYAARFHGYANRIQAGEFSVPTEGSLWQLLTTLQNAKPVTYRIVIPEGNNIYQVAEAIVAKGLIPSSQDFLTFVMSPAALARFQLQGLEADSLEGYLFPETYEFTRLDDIEKMVHVMVGEFRRRFPPEWEQRSRELGFSPHEIVILASVIEKETSVGTERPVISSVFHNRLKKGMKLQSDPTTIYGIKNFDGNLRKKDLLEWTPYNTYRVKRLPKGPIANPGTEAIRAALYPAKSDYLYFVARNDGSHHFSTTYAEHNRAVQWYQKKGNKGPMPSGQSIGRSKRKS